MQGAQGAGPGGPTAQKTPLHGTGGAADDDEEKAKTKPYVHLPRHGGAWLLLIGALFMFSSLVAPWWSWTLNSQNQNASLYLFVWGISCFGISCPGYASNPISPPSVPAMGAGSLPANLGILYYTAAGMAIAAAVVGLIAALIVFSVARGSSNDRKAVDHAVLLSYLAVAIAVSIPIMLAVAMPSSFLADYQFPLSMSPTPGTAFYGSLGAGTYNHISYTSMSWGPTYSWFLTIFGALFFFAGGLVPHTTRDEPVTRMDLIRAGLLKLRFPVPSYRPLPPGARPAGLPAGGGYGGYAQARPLPYPGQPQVYSSYGPNYQTLAPGVGWARPLPPGARPVPAALPAPAGAAPVRPMAAPPPRPAPAAPVAPAPRPPPSFATYRPPPATSSPTGGSSRLGSTTSVSSGSGATYVARPVNVTAAGSTASAPATRACPACGTKVALSTPICTNCGASLG